MTQRRCGSRATSSAARIASMEPGSYWMSLRWWLHRGRRDRSVKGTSKRTRRNWSSRQFSTAFSPQRSTIGTLYSVEPTDYIVDGEKRDAALTGRELVDALPVPLMEAGDPSSRVLAATSYTSLEQRVDTLEELYADESVPSHDSVGMVMSLTRAYLEHRAPRVGGPYREAVDLVWSQNRHR